MNGYDQMNEQDKLSLLRRAKESADMQRNGDVREEVDAWRREHPNAPPEEQYDYPRAARDKALPAGPDQRLPNEYRNDDGDGQFNPDTGNIEYEIDIAQEGINTLPPQMKGKAQLSHGLLLGAQNMVNGTVEVMANAARAYGVAKERDVLLSSFDHMDMKRAQTDPEYYSTEMARLGELMAEDSVETEYAEFNTIDVLKPSSMSDQIVADLATFLGPYSGVRTGMGAIRVAQNPTKFGNYLNKTYNALKEVMAGALGDVTWAAGTDMEEGLTTMVRDAMEDAYLNDDPNQSFGEWLSDIGLEAEDLDFLDPEQADNEVDRLARFAAEGVILGALLPLVFKAFGGTMKGTRAVVRDVAQGGFSGPSPGSQAAQRGSIDLAQGDRTRAFSGRLKSYATQDEIDLLTPKNVRRVEELLETSATVDEVVSMAAAGGAKRGWYMASVQALRHVFGDDAQRFAAALSATSPQTSVESNLRNTLNVWKNWEAAGRPMDDAAILRIMGDSVEGTKGEKSVLDAWKNNTLRALKHSEFADLSGPKVDSFRQNLAGFFNEVTQDTWMARGLGMLQGRDFSGRALKRFGKRDVKGPGYVAGNMLVREAAEKISKATGEEWTPAEIQETVWSWVKTIWEESGKKGETRTIPQLLRDASVTDDMIRDTPDFGTMFGQSGEFRTILEEAGYGSKLNDIPDPGFGSRGAVSTGPGQSGSLGSAAERLQRTKKRTGQPVRNKKGKWEYPEEQNREQLHQLFTRTFRGPPTADGPLPQRFGGRPRRSGGHYLSGERVRTYSLEADLQKQFNKHGVSTPVLNEFDNPQKFHEAIAKGKASQGDLGGAVHVYTADEYADMRTFLSSDGSSGFAIKPDGDIVSVFNTKGGKQKNIIQYLVALAVEQGGKKLDAFDIGGFLPTMYKEMGFNEVNRLPWNDEYAPPDWNYLRMSDFVEDGRPDIVMMELN